MSNPTGTTYLQANNSYTWVDGDIYEIPQSDEVEGAATGASFSDLGVDNQPHQVMLNKIQLTHTKQLTDEMNIATLQTFAALFTSTVGVNGYLQLGAQDTAKGQIAVILQWGTISLIGQSPSVLRNGVFNFNFPIAFPNAIWVLLPYWQSNNATGELAFSSGNASGGVTLEAITPLQKQGNQIGSDQIQKNNGDITIATASSPNDGNGITGIGWLALGY